MLVMCQQLIYAQSRGFLGKRFSVGYSFEFMPYMNILNDKRVNSRDGYKGANPQIITGHHINLGINLGRSIEFIGYAGIRKRDVEWMPYGILTGNKSYKVPYNQVKNVKMNETFIDFGFRSFFKKYVSPVGFYQQFMFGTAKLQFSNDSKDITLPSNYSEGNEPTTYNLSFKNAKPIGFFRFTYGLGIKQMLSKSIFINVEGNIHIAIGADL
jgi:hypothetical protein